MKIDSARTIAAGLFCAFLFAGCSVVKPWERDILSEPTMIFDENRIEKGIQEHFLDYREGSAGGTGAQGGGCGCG